MVPSRRDLVKLSAFGLGSIATTGLSAGSADACWWLCKRPAVVPIWESPDKDQETRSPEILITSLISGATVSRNFTVYGTYDLARYSTTRPVQSIVCTLTWQTISASFGASFSDSTWMANITVPNPPTAPNSGITLSAKLTLTDPTINVLPATVDNLNLASDDSGQNPLTVTAPRGKPEAEPHGTFKDGVSVVTSVYIAGGTPGVMGDGGKIIDQHQLAQLKSDKSWKASHRKLPPHVANASYVATAIGLLNGKFVFFTTSVRDLKQ